MNLDPVSFCTSRQHASVLYLDRHYDAALGQVQHTRELHDDPGEIENWMSWA